MILSIGGVVKIKSLPSKQYLEECFRYDAVNGLLYWKERPSVHFKNPTYYKSWNARYAGKLALNSNHKEGYKTGSLDNSDYLAHRIIYKLIHGVDPEIIDHAMGNKINNKPDSLKSGTYTDNNRHLKLSKLNKSGTTGVHQTKSGMWRAMISINSKDKHLGYFENLEDAIAARKAAEVEYGYHPEHGRKL